MEATSSTASNSYSANVVAPFSSGFRSFLAESRKCQTLYANCEGSYDRRVLKEGQEGTLEDYIYNTMYYSEGGFRLSEKDPEKIGKVSEIRRKILSISGQQRTLCGETHFTAVWVYYFLYNGERTMCTPVFKVYTTKERDDAVFVDVHLNEYKNWDDYLENASFPCSFLCVPRHGRYCFDGVEQKLDLEFVTTTRSSDNRGTLQYLRPFSQVSVRPWIARLQECGAAVRAKIEHIMTVLVNFCNKQKEGIFKAVLFGISVVKLIYQGCSGVVSRDSTISILLNYGEMFLNASREESGAILKSLSPDCSTELSQLPSTAVQEVQRDQEEFIAALREQKKNWRKILKYFCSLFVKCRPVLMSVLTTCTNNPLLVSGVHLLLMIIETLEQSGFVNPAEEQNEGMSLRKQTREIEYNCSSVLEESVSGLEVMPWKGSDVSQKSPKYSAADVRDARVTLSCVSELLTGMKDLDKHPVKTIEQKASMPSRCASSSSSSPDCGRLLLKDLGEFKLYLLQRLSVPGLLNSLRDLLGTDFRLQVSESYVYEVVDTSGTVRGTLYFPLKHTGLFCATVLPSGTATETEIFDDVQGVSRGSF